MTEQEQAAAVFDPPDLTVEPRIVKIDADRTYEVGGVMATGAILDEVVRRALADGQQPPDPNGTQPKNVGARAEHGDTAAELRMKCAELMHAKYQGAEFDPDFLVGAAAKLAAFVLDGAVPEEAARAAASPFGNALREQARTAAGGTA